MAAVGIDDGLYEGSAGAPAIKPNAAVRVRFYMDALKNKTKSKEAGRPIFDDVEFVEKFVVGDKTSIVQRPATDLDRRQHAQEYALFKQGDAEQVSGTPLKELPGVTKSQLEELVYVKVRTVEQLASISDGNLQQMGMGYRSLRDRAKDWLAAAQGHAPTAALRAELEQRDKQIAAMQSQLEELKALVSKQPKNKQ